MSFKRALWSSGYTYQITCNYCGTSFTYDDRRLDFRPWFPNGFVYCPRCRKPLRHNEYFAIRPDGSKVYNSIAEAEQAVNIGYLNARGITPPPAQPYGQPPAQPYGQPAYQPPVPPYGQPACQPPVQPAGQPSDQPTPQPQPSQCFCPQCGRPYVTGRDRFCAGCGFKLD